MDFTKYTDNELAAIQTFFHALRAVTGPLWIQVFFRDIQDAVMKEWKRRP